MTKYRKLTLVEGKRVYGGVPNKTKRIRMGEPGYVAQEAMSDRYATSYDSAGLACLECEDYEEGYYYYYG